MSVVGQNIAHYYEGDPGVQTFSNGDPGYPPEPTTMDIEEISCDAPLTDLINSIEGFYEYKLTRIKKELILRARKVFEDIKNGKEVNIEDSLKWISYGFTFQDSYTEELSDYAAEAIQNEY